MHGAKIENGSILTPRKPTRADSKPPLQEWEANGDGEHLTRANTNETSPQEILGIKKADGEGFEPTVQLPVLRFSRPVH